MYHCSIHDMYLYRIVDVIPDDGGVREVATFNEFSEAKECLTMLRKCFKYDYQMVWMVPKQEADL